jgi:hypothetical protein
LRLKIRHGTRTVLCFEAAAIAFDRIVFEVLEADLFEREFLGRLADTAACQEAEGDARRSKNGTHGKLLYSLQMG